MSVQKYPCADCSDVIMIGEGQGLCDYGDDEYRHLVVSLFDIYPRCPKPEGDEQ